jgi:thiamine biosynthesis lipoprotein
MVVPARVKHAEHVMGTVVSFDVPWDVALGPVLEWLHWVDATFSPFRSDSEVSRLGRGEVTVDECVPEMASMLRACERLRTDSSGYFTVYPGGQFDPCGYVKGWAIERAAGMLAAAGSADHIVNGGGDIQCLGERSAGEPWRLGVAHPLRPGELACAVVAPPAGFAIATSGVAERGAHIFDPVAARPALTFASVTVTGPSLTLADAYATAAYAMGDAARDWVESLPAFEALAITLDGETWRTSGFPPG